ncbi:DUF433 domain-containing protein [Candidatus Pacearchaeota archaeon]|nr:hypothetical protein [uncultured archaeon]AQS31855.1 hypothetical protein [uncultured archaeon]MBS3088552.1 DUF433 domain-containing protein [Candidatus Pacearchaeota archaeon]
MEEQRIVINQKVMAGKPIIRGTRIPVDLIVRLMAQGSTINEIIEDYPNLTKEDIKAALLYAALIAKGETIFPIKAEDD